jgi:hypothetical protein
MQEPSSPDPLSLRTNSVGDIPPTGYNPSRISGVNEGRTKRWMFAGIELPVLPLAEKQKYHGPTEIYSMLSGSSASDAIDSIVGEYVKNGKLQYYALHEDGVVQGVRSVICCVTIPLTCSRQA